MVKKTNFMRLVFILQHEIREIYSLKLHGFLLFFWCGARTVSTFDEFFTINDHLRNPLLDVQLLKQNADPREIEFSILYFSFGI